jgi:hypothetical protein
LGVEEWLKVESSTFEAERLKFILKHSASDLQLRTSHFSLLAYSALTSLAAAAFEQRSLRPQLHFPWRNLIQPFFQSPMISRISNLPPQLCNLVIRAFPRGDFPLRGFPDCFLQVEPEQEQPVNSIGVIIHFFPLMFHGSPGFQQLPESFSQAVAKPAQAVPLDTLFPQAKEPLKSYFHSFV